MEHTARRLAIFKQILQQDPGQAGPEGLILQGVAELMINQVDIMANCITEFHIKFAQQYNGSPRPLPPDLAYRIKFIHEELLKEYQMAVDENDLIKQYDALLDTLYVVAGTLYLQGLPLMEGFLEIHKSNMTKELGEEGKGKFGKGVMKTANYVPPNLRFILEKLGVYQPTQTYKVIEPDEPDIPIPYNE